MPAGATYEPIATSSPTGTNTVTFSSISSSYTDLKIVVHSIMAIGGDFIQMRFNGDTGTNYSSTGLRGNGTAAESYRFSSDTAIYLETQSQSTTIPTAMIVDVFSYAGSTNKTCLVQTAADRNGSGRTERIVGLWRNTAAINSVTIFYSAAYNFSAGSRITLYGIKNSA